MLQAPFGSLYSILAGVGPNPYQRKENPGKRGELYAGASDASGEELPSAAAVHCTTSVA